MGRPSIRDKRRREIVGAFARVLADHGYAGATIVAVAEEAGVAPGLLHHHFSGKADLLNELFKGLVSGFRHRLIESDEEDRLLAYVDSALKLDEKSDLTMAKCWVGIFSEAIRNPTLFRKVRRLVDTEIETIKERSNQGLDDQQAGAILAYVIGSLVLGAFAPKKTAGFAAPGLRTLVAAMRKASALPVTSKR